MFRYVVSSEFHFNLLRRTNTLTTFQNTGHGLCVELDASDGAGALEALGLDVNAFVKSVQENVAPSIASVVDGPIEKIVEDDTKASNAKNHVVSKGSNKVANMTAGLLGSVVAEMFSSGGEMKGRCVCEEPYAPPSLCVRIFFFFSMTVPVTEHAPRVNVYVKRDSRVMTAAS